MWLPILLLNMTAGLLGFYVWYVRPHRRAYSYKGRRRGIYQYHMKTFWAPNTGVLTSAQKEL